MGKLSTKLMLRDIITIVGYILERGASTEQPSEAACRFRLNPFHTIKQANAFPIMF